MRRWWRFLSERICVGDGDGGGGGGGTGYAEYGAVPAAIL